MVSLNEKMPEMSITNYEYKQTLTRMKANIDCRRIDDVSFAYRTGYCTIDVLQLFTFPSYLFGHYTFRNGKLGHFV